MDDLEPILQRARRRTVWIAAIGAVAGGIGGLALALTDDPGLRGVLTVIGFACGVGGIAGALALILTVSTYSSDLRIPRAGIDRATRSRINGSIQAGAPVAPPSDELALRAADRAHTGTAPPVPGRATRAALRRRRGRAAAVTDVGRSVAVLVQSHLPDGDHPRRRVLRVLHPTEGRCRTPVPPGCRGAAAQRRPERRASAVSTVIGKGER